MKDVILMQQIHGNNVVMVGKKDIGTTIPNCDAMITSDPGVTLGVRVADCLPIFVVDEKGRGIGLIHAGWRGLENEIIVKTIQKMENQWKMETGKLKIIIGPHICPEHYEVKEDVASKFSSYVKGVTLNSGRTFLDLSEVARQQLVSLGVKNEDITIDSKCTFDEPILPSFRRDKTTQRNLITLSI